MGRRKVPSKFSRTPTQMNLCWKFGMTVYQYRLRASPKFLSHFGETRHRQVGKALDWVFISVLRLCALIKGSSLSPQRKRMALRSRLVCRCCDALSTGSRARSLGWNSQNLGALRDPQASRACGSPLAALPNSYRLSSEWPVVSGEGRSRPRSLGIR